MIIVLCVFRSSRVPLLGEREVDQLRMSGVTNMSGVSGVTNIVKEKMRSVACSISDSVKLNQNYYKIEV